MITVRMYDKNLHFLDIIANRTEPSFTDPMSDVGVGSFKIHTHDYILQRTSGLLSYGNIVLMHDLESNHYFAWRIESRKRKLIDSAESGRGGLMWEISGRGAGCLLGSAVVYPEYGIRRDAADDRPFNFATKTSYWYNSAQWHSPQGRSWKNDDTSRKHHPRGWPDPDAQWIWSSNPELDADPGVVYFRGSFTLATAQRVAIFATADNSYKLWLDSEHVMTGRHWKQKQRFDADLQPGTHIIGIRGVNAPLSGVNPAGVICSVYTVDPNTEKTQTNIFRTNTTDWLYHKVNQPFDPADSTTWSPGWDCGDIIDQLMAEARTRGVQAIQRINVGWTPSHDSAGVAWPAPSGRAFTVGASYLDVLDQLAETALDWRMVAGLDSDGNATLTLKIYNHLGVDRTIGANNDDGVEKAFIPGYNAQEAEFDGDGSGIVTKMLVKTQDGWIEETAGSIGTYERWETFLNAGQGQDDQHAINVANATFGQAARPTEALTIKGQSMPHHKPFIHFDIGDDILAPGDGGVSKYRLLALTLTEDTEGLVTWAPELGDIHHTRIRRHSRHLKAIARGTSGAGSAGGRVHSAIPAILTPTDVVAAGEGTTGESSHQFAFSYHGNPIALTLSGPYKAMYDETLVEVVADVNATDPTTDLVLQVILNGTVLDTVRITAGNTHGRTTFSQYITADSDILQMNVLSSATGWTDLTVMARFS